MLIKYALSHDWEVYNIYSDDDWSGADINRPQFQKLIEDCKDGKLDIVLCKTQSRFSRNMEVIEKYIHNKFIEWKVRFVSIVDNADTEVQENKKTRQINGLINEWYLEDLSKNIRSSLQNKREDGLFLGSFAPYGYVKDPNNKNKLVIDQVASEVVKEIFELFKSGIGCHKIAKILNDKEILTPSNYKKENGSKYVCGRTKQSIKTKWSSDSITKLLKNETYIGNLAQGKKTYISYKNHKMIVKPKEQWTICYGTHEPIIDIETWNYVQSKFKSRIRTSKTIGEVYMLSKKVYCKECGRVFNRQLYHTKDSKTAYMKCKGGKDVNCDCKNKSSIRCDILEDIILNELNNQLNKYYNLYELDRMYNQEKKDINNLTFAKKNRLFLEKEKLQEKIIKKNEYYKLLYEDKINGVITQEEFVIFRKIFLKEIEEYKKRIEVINLELFEIQSTEGMDLSPTEMFKKYKQIKKLNRKIIDEFINVIFIGKINPDTNERNIDIEINLID